MFCFLISDHEMVPQGTVSFKCGPMQVQPPMKRQKTNSLGPVHERLISDNPGLKLHSVLCILPSCVVLRLTFCVIITVSK